jgi:hypothetical protein
MTAPPPRQQLRGRCVTAFRSREHPVLYVIKNLDTGRYVSRRGLGRSYTVKLKELRFFSTALPLKLNAAETRSSRS